MADIKGIMFGLPIMITAVPAATNFVIDASGERASWVFKAEEAATITHLGHRYGARTGTPPEYRISLQAIDASTGRADGTVLGGGTPASKTFTPPADATWDGTWRWHQLDNAYTLTADTYYAIVIDYSSGTIDGSNNSSFTTHFSATAQIFPFMATYNGSAWSTTNAVCSFGYKSASRVYGQPIKNLSAVNLASGSTPDEAGVKWTPPAGLGDTYQVCGMEGFFRCLSTGVAGTMRLYDSGGSVVQSTAIDTDVFQAAASGYAWMPFDRGSLSTLTFGQAVRLTWLPTNNTNMFSMYYLETDTNAEMEAFGGTDMIWTQRTDAGAWTDTDTRKPLFVPKVSAWSEPSAGGGGYIF